MKVEFFLLSFAIFIDANAHADCSCTSVNHDRTKPHIQLSLGSTPDLKFFDNKNFKGEPSIRLNEKGAYIGNELLCSWPQGSFTKEIEANRALGFDGQEVSNPCPVGFPIESGFGDLGVGTAILCLEVSRQSGDAFEVLYEGKSYFLDPKTLKSMNWKMESGTNEPCGQPK